MINEMVNNILISVFNFGIINSQHIMSDKLSPCEDNKSLLNTEKIAKEESPYSYEKKEKIIDMEPSIEKIQIYFQEKIIKENIVKAVKKTLLRRNIIVEGEFKE